MHRDILGRIDTHPDLSSFDTQHGHGDVIADHQGLADPPREDQHLASAMTGGHLVVLFIGIVPGRGLLNA